MLRSATLRLWGGRAAVFALWLQLAISAGHMHPEDVFGPSGHAIVQGQGGLSGQAVGRDRRDPSSTDPYSEAETDGCAICAAMQMVAVAVPPLLFQLPVPLAPAIGPARPVADECPTAAPFRLFQSRAPPLV